MKPPPDAPAGPEAEAQLIEDRDTLREIVAGLDRLEQIVPLLRRIRKGWRPARRRAAPQSAEAIA